MYSPLIELFVTLPGFALEVAEAMVITVPLPQPETVQSFNFFVTVAVDASGVVYTSATHTFSVRSTTLSELAGRLQALEVLSVVTFAFTVVVVTVQRTRETIVSPVLIFVYL